MISNIRSSLLCSLLLLAALTSAGGYEKQQDTYAPPQPQPQVTKETVYITQAATTVTVTTCCKGTITQETTTVITGPTYTAGTTVTQQVDYTSYWIQGNVTISSETSSIVNTTFISNPVPHVGPSTAIADPGIKTLNSLPSPCTTILITQTLSFDPILNTAVYYRDRVETEFTIPVFTTTTPTPTPTQAPVVQINDGQVQNVVPSSSNESAPAEAPPAAQAGAPADRVSRFALGLFIGAAIVALL